MQTFITDIKDLGTAAEIAIKPIKWLAEVGVGAFNLAVKAVGAVGFAASDAAANEAARDRASKLGAGLDRGTVTPGAYALAPHADGGMVTGIHDGRAEVRPAPGEGLASVGRGEMILPAGRTISPSTGPPPANDNAGSGGVRVENLTIHIDAPAGVTGAQELSVTGLTIALERLQLAVGR